MNSDINMIADILRNAPEHNDSVEQKLLPCPGLNGDEKVRAWYYPANADPTDMTFCQQCVQEHNLQDMIMIYESDYFCDTHRLRSKLDNGVINVSFWTEDQSTCLYSSETETIMRVGQKVLCVINSYGLRANQIYNCTIKQGGKVLYTEERFMENTADLLSAPISFEEGEVQIVIDIFKKTPRDFSKYSNHDFGRLVFHKQSKQFHSASEKKYIMNSVVPFNTELIPLKSKVEFKFRIKVTN